jgi:hypothetical protein
MTERPVEHTLLATTDAMVWAEEFCRIFDGHVVVGSRTLQEIEHKDWTKLDEGTMVAWFANAIETGRSAGQGQVVVAQTNDDHTISLVTELDMDRDVRISPQLLVQMIEQHNRSLQSEVIMTPFEESTLEESFQEGFQEGRVDDD